MIRVVAGVECESISGNVFADLGLPDAEKLKIKSGLVIEIRNAVRILPRRQPRGRLGQDILVGEVDHFRYTSLRLPMRTTRKRSSQCWR